MNEATLEVVEAKARTMEMDRVIEELEKSEIPEVRERIQSVIDEERTCPECQNDMLWNEKDELLYCPLGHFEYSG